MIKDFELSPRSTKTRRFYVYKPDRSMCVFYWSKIDKDTMSENLIWLLDGFDEDTLKSKREVGYSRLTGSVHQYHMREGIFMEMEGIQINPDEHYNMDILFLDNNNIVDKFLKQSGILMKS